MAKKQEEKPKAKRGRKPDYDYTSDEFLDRIEEYARKGYTDREIAIELNLNQTYFSEQKTAFPEIAEALSRGRAKVNSAVRQKYLSVSLGLAKRKSVTRKLPSKFEDDSFIDSDGLVVFETIEDIDPSLQGLGNWLFNHDDEWRQKVIDGKRLDVTSGARRLTTLLYCFYPQMN